MILPQRNPLVLAKALASLDVVSGGRLIFGLGIGYRQLEFDHRLWRHGLLSIESAGLFAKDVWGAYSVPSSHWRL